jgi:hypothetical protein
MQTIHTYYDTLHVARNASPEVVRAAYRALSQQYHPDKNPQRIAKCERIQKLINEAYAVLSDPAHRAQYDAWIREQERDSVQQGSPGMHGQTEKITIPELVVRTRVLVQVVQVWFGVFGVMFGLGFFFAGWATLHGTLSSFKDGFLALLGILSGISIFLLSARNLLTRRATLIASEEGILIRPSFSGGIQLRWSDIAEFRLKGGFFSGRKLFVVLYQPEIVLARHRRFDQQPVRDGDGRVGITIDDLDLKMPLDKLVQELRWRQRYFMQAR